MKRAIIAIFFLQLFLTIFATRSRAISEYVLGSLIGMNVLIWGKQGLACTIISLFLVLYQVAMCVRYGLLEPGQFLLYSAGLAFSSGCFDLQI